MSKACHPKVHYLSLHYSKSTSQPSTSMKTDPSEMHEISEKDHAVASALPTSSSSSGEQSAVAADAKSEVDNDIHTQSGTSSIHADEDENHDPEDIHPRLQRQTTEIGPAVKVSRLKRRGLFGQLALVAEVENPKTYPRRMKWFITFVVALAGSTAPMGSSIFFRKSPFKPWHSDQI
jgi:hypothetical protein